MTNDGRWAITCDAEKEGRRISKVTESFVSGAWTITLSNRFVYDGWNLLAELNATNNAVINSFVWGLDLSGSLQGAGGAGGLLFVSATNAGTHFAGFDGNVNVAVLVSATNGTATANYEYDPFGNVLRATGPMALLNPFRFSTKYTSKKDESPRLLANQPPDEHAMGAFAAISTRTVYKLSLARSKPIRTGPSRMAHLSRESGIRELTSFSFGLSWF